MLLLINLVLYHFTKERVFYWFAIIWIIVYLSALAFIIGMYIPIIRSLL